jgi:hypothetical protein
MNEYRFFLMRPDNTIQDTRVHRFSDDETALEYASQLVDGHDIEAWQGSRLLKRFKSPDPIA